MTMTELPFPETTLPVRAGRQWRTTDPDTSAAAAASITAKHMSELQRLIVDLYRKHGGMSDETLITQIRAQYRIAGDRRPSDSSVRTRRRELVVAGLVCDSGRRNRTISGRASIVWHLEKGGSG